MLTGPANLAARRERRGGTRRAPGAETAPPQVRRLRDVPRAPSVGRGRRSPVGCVLLPTLPFRKLGTLLFGAGSAPAGTTVGGGGAIAAKVLAATAIGGTAVGVTVKEVARPPTPPFHSSAVS